MLHGRRPIFDQRQWGIGYYTPAYYQWLFRQNNPKRPFIFDDLEWKKQMRRDKAYVKWGYGYVWKRRAKRGLFVEKRKSRFSTGE